MSRPAMALMSVFVIVLVRAFVASAVALGGDDPATGPATAAATAAAAGESAGGSDARGHAGTAGAKDLFFDPSGGAVSVQPPARLSAAQSSTQPTQPVSAAGVQPTRSGSAGAGQHSERHGRGQVPATKTGKAAAKSCGIHYWIELEEPGRYVSDQQVFHSGQRIRLHFVSNADGRILLLQLGASGTSTLLFPDPRKELTDNRLKAGEDRILPSDAHWFRFDANAGTERLLVLFARDAAELESFPVKPQMGPVETRAVLQTASRIAGSKDLVIETETRTAAEVGTYGVNLKGEPVILEISLLHR
jgi:hypothetical protein